MTAHHTPGPWRIAAGNATGFKTGSGGESILASARPTDDFFILKIAEMDTNVPAVERAANARLIAAAPRLLSELREAVDLILQITQARWSEWEGSEEETVGSFRAAIAEAARQ